MTRKSGRRRCTFFSRPSSVSLAKLRSCASSTITTLQEGHSALSVAALPEGLARAFHGA